VPDFDHFGIFFGDSFPEQHLIPIEVVIVAGSNPTQFLLDEHGPSPGLPSLNTVPKFMFDRLASVREAKHTLLRD
jgi:hypothetical protein